MSTEPDSSELASAVPIREVSRVTGVNSVTLRAWERRYGLLKPLRTEKGHRLYRPEDIARVEEIQSWLARGVAVSQVKALLGRPAPEAGLEPVPEEGPWEAFARRLQAAVGSLQGQALDSLLAELALPILWWTNCWSRNYRHSGCPCINSGRTLDWLPGWPFWKPTCRPTLPRRCTDCRPQA